MPPKPVQHPSCTPRLVLLPGAPEVWETECAVAQPLSESGYHPWRRRGSTHSPGPPCKASPPPVEHVQPPAQSSRPHHLGSSGGWQPGQGTRGGGSINPPEAMMAVSEAEARRFACHSPSPARARTHARTRTHARAHARTHARTLKRSPFAG